MFKPLVTFDTHWLFILNLNISHQRSPINFWVKIFFQIKRNLQTYGHEVDNELIRSTWHTVFRRHLLRKALERCYECRRAFFMYSQVSEAIISHGKLQAFELTFKMEIRISSSLIKYYHNLQNIVKIITLLL